MHSSLKKNLVPYLLFISASVILRALVNFYFNIFWGFFTCIWADFVIFFQNSRYLSSLEFLNFSPFPKTTNNYSDNFITVTLC